MITSIEDYFSQGCGRCSRFSTPDCSTQKWTRGLSNLRRICLDSGLDETLKWAHPCYTLRNRNIAIVGAFRDDFRLSFFNAALLKDPEHILERAGPNTRHASMIRFSDDARVAQLEPVIFSYLSEAICYADAGVIAPKEQYDIELQDELNEALDADPELAAAFDRLTPGRQRSYVINLSAAKKTETRIARIDKFRNKIIAGKGALER